ncbi:ParB/RepB/Spo0J family partition protein [Ensifer sp. ENS02]|uniref:ParB/RepB/Spo0J family partition protein n=1 Tax=Ensifer sp. ENS02 TaxID=2769290 RepID=UPI001FF0293B|nr:ParB/RepB/Spo0J family partition protein [Ensifer sp. ENS02]
MTTTILIELNKLDADPKNVRKSYSEAKLAELAANIDAEGVLQNLVVRAGDKSGRYFVTAGERRRRALLMLVEQGKIAKDHHVEYKVREAADATEISLSENVFREDMHPIDQFEAFSVMIAEGKTIADIAANFSITEIIVRRRLALVKVSPKLLEVYREGKMTFEQLSAFTVSDDHQRQEQVWENLPQWDRHAQRIKSNLVTDEVASTDKRVRLIGGLDTYEAAGGPVRRDLFGEQGEGYALDVALLDRLVSEKLEQLALPYRDKGWKWVETQFQRPDWIFSIPRIYPDDVELSAEDQAEYDALVNEHGDLAELIDGEADDEAAGQRIAEIDRRLDEISAKKEAYRPEDMARSGVVVFVTHHGAAEVALGIVRDDDEADGEHDTDGGGSGSAAINEENTDTPAGSARLQTKLQQHSPLPNPSSRF